MYQEKGRRESRGEPDYALLYCVRRKTNNRPQWVLSRFNASFGFRLDGLIAWPKNNDEEEDAEEHRWPEDPSICEW